MPTPPKLILASASPRRRGLLAQLGVDCEVCAAEVDERRLTGETPAAMTQRLALLKARTVAARLATAQPVLGGDTAVVIGDEVLGKPADRAAAAAMLRRLSGRTHRVFTAVALLHGERQAQRLSVTEVTFARLAARHIRFCLAGDEPFDKAGGYAIQGRAGSFITRIRGSYHGVVGLPLWETRELLRELLPALLPDSPPEAA